VEMCYQNRARVEKKRGKKWFGNRQTRLNAYILLYRFNNKKREPKRKGEEKKKTYSTESCRRRFLHSEPHGNQKEKWERDGHSLPVLKNNLYSKKRKRGRNVCGGAPDNRSHFRPLRRRSEKKKNREDLPADQKVKGGGQGGLIVLNRYFVYFRREKKGPGCTEKVAATSMSRD